jgi:putative peptide zinc metalloprotease protein
VSAAAKEAPGAGAPLPCLRADLRLELVPEGEQSFPSVVATDPVRACYFRFVWPESGLLLAWHQAGSMDEMRAVFRATFGGTASDLEIDGLVRFATANQLIEADGAGAWQRLAAAHVARRRSIASLMLHNYLFFRVPLVRPEPWLRALLPWLSFAFARWFWVLVGAIALLGVHLALRQWSSVLAGASGLLELQSLAVYALAILALKSVHELGHALTTVRLGCRVPTMGVALILGVPVFYTDASDSWRLARRRDRMAIALAGVAAELVVAALAILLWSFLPDGLWRQLCFALATTSLALTLAVNLNPFMRFDGYFALSDWLGVPNLQARAFALGLWRVREALFGLGHPPPEELPPRLRRTLVAYAAATAIYRLFLFLGIAAVVYVVAGKAIGIVLALAEIGIFIALPIWRELREWWSLRHEIVCRPRGWRTAAIAAGGLAVLFAPTIASVEAPAVLQASREEGIYLPFAARLARIEVVNGARVRTGEVLFVAEAPDLGPQLRRAWAQEQALLVQIARLPASEKEREHRLVLEARLDRTRQEIAAIGRRMRQLVIRAPFDGRIVDVDPEISAGIWLDQKRPLAYLVSEQGLRARGVIAETDLRRIVAGAHAVFVPDDAAGMRRELVVASIAPASDGRFAEPMLADRHGGSILAGDRRGELVARSGIFEVTFAERPGELSQVVRGIARIEAERISPARLVWQAIARVVVREQGF